MSTFTTRDRGDTPLAPRRLTGDEATVFSVERGFPLDDDGTILISECGYCLVPDPPKPGQEPDCWMCWGTGAYPELTDKELRKKEAGLKPVQSPGIM